MEPLLTWSSPSLASSLHTTKVTSEWSTNRVGRSTVTSWVAITWTVAPSRFTGSHWNARPTSPSPFGRPLVGWLWGRQDGYLGSVRPERFVGGPAKYLGGVLKQIAQRVAEGETVTFRPTGSSMVPLIQNRDEVIVSPVDPARVEVGDIVLTKVAGNVYIHLVKAIEPAKRRVQIGNNRGGINGWTGFDRVYGIAVSVAGVERPGAKAKVVQRDT
jgi:hypothetical protein